VLVYKQTSNQHRQNKMKLINGVYHYAAWESEILYFKTLKTKKSGAGLRLGELLATEIYVTLAILEEETLDWEYKLKHLITRKDLKQGSRLIEMLIEHLRRPSSTFDAATVRAAHQLRGAWSELGYVQSRMLRNDKHIKECVMHAVRSRVMDSVAALLQGIKRGGEGENINNNTSDKT
jgi:hypothetical protein